MTAIIPGAGRYLLDAKIFDYLDIGNFQGYFETLCAFNGR